MSHGTVLEPARCAADGGIDEGVFRVGVVNRIAQRIDCGDWIGVHPHEMARVEVGADDVAYFLTKLQQRRHIVDELVAVELNAQLLDAVGSSSVRKPSPIGQKLFFPLPLEDRLGLRRPRRDDPVRHAVAGRTSGQSRHHADPRHSEETGETHRVVNDLGLPIAVRWMKLIAVRVQRDELESPVCESLEKTTPFALAR